MRCLRRTNQVQNTKTFHNNTKITVKKTVDLQDGRPHVKYFTNWLSRMLGAES